MYCHKNVGQNHIVKMANKLIKNVAEFRFLGTDSKYTFIKKWRPDWIWGMLAIQFRIFYFPIFDPRNVGI
jgi:hypothetical protein